MFSRKSSLDLKSDESSLFFVPFQYSEVLRFDVPEAKTLTHTSLKLTAYAAFQPRGRSRENEQETLFEEFTFE